MNLVALIGNVASEPELRSTANDRAVCTFRLAVSRPGGTAADFFTVVAWERQAEICKEYLQIGRRVGVEGRIHHSTWEHEGARRSKVEVIAHRVQLLGAKRSQSDSVASTESGAGDNPDFMPIDDQAARESSADDASQSDVLAPV